MRELGLLIFFLFIGEWLQGLFSLSLNFLYTYKIVIHKWTKKKKTEEMLRGNWRDFSIAFLHKSIQNHHHHNHKLVKNSCFYFFLSLIIKFISLLSLYQRCCPILIGRLFCWGWHWNVIFQIHTRRFLVGCCYNGATQILNKKKSFKKSNSQFLFCFSKLYSLLDNCWLRGHEVLGQD